jgi:type IV pilus assembly protein PilB
MKRNGTFEAERPPWARAADEVTTKPAQDAADPPRPGVRRHLGEVLVEQGAITPEQLDGALSEQMLAASQGGRRVRLGQTLIERGHVTDRQIGAALARAMSLRMIDLNAIVMKPDVSRLLPRVIAERHLVVPIEVDGDRLVTAFADPTNVIALDDVRAHTGFADIEVVVAVESQVRDAISRIWALSSDSAAMATILEDLDADADDEYSDVVREDSPTVKMVDLIIADAVRGRASDIHIEVQTEVVRVRYRIDGLLRDTMTVPRAAAAGIVSRIKVISNLDIAERRLPQDGRARLLMDEGFLDVRVSTLPSLLGEKVVIRLLSQAGSTPAITKLGMDEHQLEMILGHVVAPQGLILITGPTGSGKTGTLYSAINQIRTPDRNIVTLEDPVEMQVTGITQVQVNERTGLTFTRGLRAVLRQDPDVVLVGEVRDAETAKLALEASLTGHMVMTTLHTNSAPAAITRLVEIGVEPSLVASSLSLVVAQRLVRRVCEGCATEYKPAARVLTTLGLNEEDINAATPRRGAGCPECGGTGYHGRTGVFEMLPVTASLRAVLMATPTEAAILHAARKAGMQTLRASAIAKAHAGMTTYEEVLRVTQVDVADGQHCTACGGAVQEEMLACPFCATAVADDRCTGCSKTLDSAWRVCPWCRTAVPGRTLKAPANVADDDGGLPRLLVVDHDEEVHAFVRAAVEGSIDVEAVSTASEALDLIGSQSYDGLLVDQRLPDLTGLELIRLVRSEAHTAALPVMLFTGDATDTVENDALEAGVDGCLSKPVDPQLLEERLLGLVSLSGRIHT